MSAAAEDFQVSHLLQSLHLPAVLLAEARSWSLFSVMVRDFCPVGAAVSGAVSAAEAHDIVQAAGVLRQKSPTDRMTTAFLQVSEVQTAVQDVVRVCAGVQAVRPLQNHQGSMTTAFLQVSEVQAAVRTVVRVCAGVQAVHPRRNHQGLMTTVFLQVSGVQAPAVVQDAAVQAAVVRDAAVPVAEAPADMQNAAVQAAVVRDAAVPVAEVQTDMQDAAVQAAAFVSAGAFLPLSEADTHRGLHQNLNSREVHCL